MSSRDEFIECYQCCQKILVDTVNRRAKRGGVDLDLCYDCRSIKKPITNKYHFTHPVWGEMHCYLWLGELDDDWHPIDKFGKLVAPGVRLCGHKDCIAGDHVVEVETPPSQRKLEGATDERGQ